MSLEVLLTTCLDAMLQFSAAAVCFNSIDMLHVNALSPWVHSQKQKVRFTREVFCRSMPEVPLAASLWTLATCAMSPLTLCSRPLLLKVICVLLDIHCSQRTFVLESLLLLLPRLTDSSTTPCTCASEVETFAKPVQRCQVSHIHRLVMLS